MTRHETLELLLHHYPDWLTASKGGSTTGRQDSRLLHYDQELDCEAFRELDRALALMRNQGHQQNVRYTCGQGANDGQEVSCSLATCRWHLIAWYIPSRYQQPRKRQRKHHGRWETITPKPEPVRHPDARLDRAQAGLRWLDQHYDWKLASKGLNWLRKEQKIHGLTHVTGIAA